MSEAPHKKQDFLEVAKHQFAQISTEFEKALEALKDPERRKQLTSSYLEMLQRVCPGRKRVSPSIRRRLPHTQRPLRRTKDRHPTPQRPAEPKTESPEAPTS